jgi:hypothetical protein
MQTMDADLARLVRAGTITRSLAEQRASVPEELKRLLGGAAVMAPASMTGQGGNGAAEAVPAAPVGTPPASSPAPPPPSIQGG